MGETPPQSILPSDGEAAWEVVHLLVLPESLECLSLHVLAPVAQPVSALCTAGGWEGGVEEEGRGVYV